MSEEDNKRGGRDFVLLGPPAEDGTTPFIRHLPDDSVRVGTMTPSKDGVPLQPGSEILRLTKGEGVGYDVEVVYGEQDRASRNKGPSKVSSPAYKDSWERIWGKKDGLVN